MATTIYYWHTEENKKINVDDMSKGALITALKEMIKMDSLDESAKNRYELGVVVRQFHEDMLDYHAEEEDTDNPY